MENEQNKHNLLEAWFPVKERKHNTLTEKIPRITEGEEAKLPKMIWRK